MDQPYTIDIEDWGRRDIDAVIQFAQGLATALPMHFIGHSIGGQIFALAQSSVHLQSAVLVAASCPYWRRWRFPGNIKMLFVSRLLIPLVSALNKEFPSRRMGLGNASIPSTVARRWALWMSKPDYLFDDEFGVDISNYAALALPILSFDFTDDELAPAVNVRKLLQQFPNASIEQHSIDPTPLGLSAIGHSGFFNNKCRDSLWRQTLSWVGAQECVAAPSQDVGSL
ncbi:MAG: alpha/beta hydrolase family protein [Spongiibacteraceae bacterium]